MPESVPLALNKAGAGDQEGLSGGKQSPSLPKEGGCLSTCAVPHNMSHLT